MILSWLAAAADTNPDQRRHPSHPVDRGAFAPISRSSIGCPLPGGFFVCGSCRHARGPARVQEEGGCGLLVVAASQDSRARLHQPAAQGGSFESEPAGLGSVRLRWVPKPSRSTTCGIAVCARHEFQRLLNGAAMSRACGPSCPITDSTDAIDASHEEWSIRFSVSTKPRETVAKLT